MITEGTTLDGEGTTPGYLPGYGPIPADTVRGVAGTTAVKVKPLVIPPPDTKPEPRFRPSAALAEFINLRDLGCRWPGCTVPAHRCDTDHTKPWPAGPTHASNLKLYCRHHHLIKTFWFGPLGWTETQDPDGTLTIHTPDGRAYTSTPGGSLFLPQLATPTGTLTLPADLPQVSAFKILDMPTRRRTRSDERTARIQWERRRNHDADPPPF